MAPIIRAARLQKHGQPGWGPEQRRAGLRAALEAIRPGDLKLEIDDVLPVAQVNEAFERLADRKVSGKLFDLS